MLWIGLAAALIGIGGLVIALRSEAAPPTRAAIALVGFLPLALWLWLGDASEPSPVPVPEASPARVEEELPPLAPWPEEVVEREPEAAPVRVASIAAKPYTAEEVAKLRDRTALMGTANVIRHYEGQLQDWHMVGLKVSNVKPRSFWALAGVRSGDLIVEWEGEPVTGAEISIRVIKELGTKERLDFVVIGTDGEEREIRYELPDELRLGAG